MDNLTATDSDSLRPKGEELPIEEFDGVPDWNAEAWRLIQARDAGIPKKQIPLPHTLSAYSLAALDSTFAVLNRTKQDPELRDAIAAEIERRIDLGDVKPG